MIFFYLLLLIYKINPRWIVVEVQAFSLPPPLHLTHLPTASPLFIRLHPLPPLLYLRAILSEVDISGDRGKTYQAGGGGEWKTGHLLREGWMVAGGGWQGHWNRERAPMCHPTPIHIGHVGPYAMLLSLLTCLPQRQWFNCISIVISRGGLFCIIYVLIY